MGVHPSDRSLRLGVLLAVVSALMPLAGTLADCPPGAAPERLDGLPLGDAFRTRVMEVDPPTELYRKAMARPGEIFIERDGKQGLAVLVAPVAIEPFWRALNDDEHHDEGGHIPLRTSVVIEGEPASSGRRTFQYFKRAGIGRWWVNRLEMNADLYRATGGRIWELSWHDVMDEYPGEEPPVAIDDEVARLVYTLGAWMLVPLAEECLLVEYATRGDPGGLLGSLQFLVATRAVRNMLEGMLEMSRGHASASHDGVRFVRPDGTALEDEPGS
jgi:hypothetical protein